MKDGLFIAKSKLANSMIDSSDGFDKSIRFICQESNVGCEIYFDKIPVSKSFKDFTYHFPLSTSRFVLFGGEEYELIFTVPNEKKSYFGNKYYEVGKITKDKRIVYIDKSGKKLNFSEKGYDHFKK